MIPVVSLLGTVLIARPSFIFGSIENDPPTGIENGMTTEQQMVAVWRVIASSFLCFSVLTWLLP